MLFIPIVRFAKFSESQVEHSMPICTEKGTALGAPGSCPPSSEIPFVKRDLA